MNQLYQVAIDGPAASGKSTTARGVAAGLGIQYLDTGAMYRALTLHVLETRVGITDEAAVAALLPAFELEWNEGRLLMAGRDVSHAIRENRISVSMGPICAMPPVREWMVREQRRLGNLRSCVVDGRDIGTVVLPDARFKFFLTADPEVRARRRQLELAARGETHELKDLLRELNERDKSDREREVGPLKQAADARLVDTSDLSLEEQVELIVRIVQRGLAEVTPG